MNQTVTVFFSFQASDLWFLAQAAGRTLLISVLAIGGGTLLGIVFGWLLNVGRWWGAATLGLVLDLFRSVPLIIQLILFFNFFPIVGLPLNPFVAGTIVLGLYTSALVANVARGGIEAVGEPMRRAARSLGMTYWQDLRYVVWPIGLRAVFPSWVGVALGVLKDSALVSVLTVPDVVYEARVHVAKTFQALEVWNVVALVYLALTLTLSLGVRRLERRGSWPGSDHAGS